MEALASYFNSVDTSVIRSEDDLPSRKSRELGQRLYEAIYARFAQETDGGKASNTLEFFVKDPDYSSVVEKKLSHLLQTDPAFADTLHQIIQASFNQASLHFQTLFVGREQEQQLYQNFLTGEMPWILVVTGQAGSGKSALLHYLAQHTPAAIRIVTLNFAYEALRIDPLNILEELSWKLAADCDTQRASIFEKTLQEGRNRLLELSRQMTQTVIVGDAGSLKDAQLSMSGVDSATMRVQRRQVREMVTSALYAQLVTFQPVRLVVLLDTCEWLSEPEDSEVGRWVIDELIPGVHGRMVQRHQQCSVVIASRTHLSPSDVDHQEIITFALPQLEFKAVERYLKHIGIQDLVFCQHIYAITHGHALSVAIIGALWQEGGEQSFTIADLLRLEEEFKARALLEFFQKRVDSRLKSPFRELNRYGILLRSFDLPMLQAVFPELLPDAEALGHFHQLIKNPYIQALGNHHYAFHDLLREIQADAIREQEPQKWIFYHQRALNYLSQLSPRPLDWYYHALACNERQGILDWQQAVLEARIEGAQERLSGLLQIGSEKTLKPTPIVQAIYTYELGRSYHYLSQWERALESYTQALVLYRQVGAVSDTAKVYQAMGNVQRFRSDSKDLNAALQSYMQAFSVYQQMKDTLDQIYMLYEIGNVQRHLNQLDAVQHSYKKALVLYETLNDHSDLASTYKVIGNMLQFCDNKNGALESYRHALALYQSMEDYIGEINILQEIDALLQADKDQHAVVELLPSEPKKSIEIFFSYAHKDETLRDELAKHLSILKWQKQITNWYDRKIDVGEEWAGEIDLHLNTAHIILLLVSADFLASDYCYGVEMKRALERHESREAKVIPIILRPVDWKRAPFSKLQALPKNAKPVTTWTRRDAAFLDIAKSIREVVEELTTPP